MAEKNMYPNKKEQAQSEISFYWQYYGLSRDPFSAVRDDSMYFSLQSWEYHLDLLQHLIKSENVLLAVIGCEGVGKSTLAHQFMHQIGDAMQIHQFEADSLFSTRKLVRELEQGFHLKAPINESPEEQLDAQIAEVQYSDKTCLLIIDDAHYLPLETLNSLLFLLKQQSKNQMRLHILLFGDKNLQTKLSNLAKHEITGELIHTIELHKLTLDETKQYLTHRLQKSGLTASMPFSQMDIEKIYSTSNGAPDRINRVAQQMMLDELAKQKSYANPSLLRKHQSKAVGGLLVVCALVGLAYLLNKEGDHAATPSNTQPVIEFADHSQVETLPPPSQQATNPQPTAVVVATAKIEDVIPAVQVPQGSGKQQAGLTSAVPNIAVAAKALEQVSIQEKKSERLAQLEQIHLSPSAREHHKDLMGRQFEKSAHKHTVKAAKTNTAAKTTTTQSKLAVEKINKQPQTASSAIENQFANVKNNSYTIQLVGLSHEGAIKGFMAKHPSTTYLKTTLKGKPWYVLIYGKYPNYSSAEKAIKQLPEDLQQFKPWPRTYASVQEGMEKNNG